MTKQVSHSLENHVKALADYLPNGRMFEAKLITGNPFHELLRGLAGELGEAERFLITLEEEFIPDKTNLFLDEWESALQIPDGCFKGTGTNDERRRDILTKLASLGIQTRLDFIDLAAIFGITVNVISGGEVGLFPMTFPFFLFDSARDARNTIIITFTVTAPSVFPYTFPITFGSGEIAILECLFNRLKPSHCNVIFQQVT